MSVSHHISREFKKIDKRRTLSIMGFLFILAFFPVFFSSSGKTQETRSHAALTANQAVTVPATASLSFYPPSSFSNPIQGSVGQPLSIDLMLAPGNNHIKDLHVHIVFPKNTFSIASAKFVVNKAVFPVESIPPKVTEGANGDITFLVTTADPKTTTIGYEAKVGTLTLTPIKVVDQNNQNDGVIGFLPVTSAGASDVNGDAITKENQAYIFVSPQGSAVPTPVLPGSTGGTAGSPGPTNPAVNNLKVQLNPEEAYSPQPSIWLFLVPVAVTFFTILFY
jgi:hypothetical protein